MISGIKGVVILKSAGFAYISTASGLSYLVNLGVRDILNICVGQEIFLFCASIIREDSHSLYGFLNYEDLLWFEMLKKVSGVGPKVSLGVLGAFDADDLSQLIQDKNSALLASRVSGLGKKTAEKLVLDLEKETLKIKRTLSETTFATEIEPSSPVQTGSNTVKFDKIIMEAVSAATNLGFDEKASFQIASKIFSENSKISLESLIFTLINKLGS
jgi:Holliday junction DNA helicase RuvA